MGHADATHDLSAALVAEAGRLGAALMLLAVQEEGRWWILAASAPALAVFPDPVELWTASTRGMDAGRAPAAVCELLGRRPAQRWISEAGGSPELRLAVYWTEARSIAPEALAAARDRLIPMTRPALMPALATVDPAILARIIESVPVALIFFDCGGMTVVANRSARELLGLRHADLTPRRVARRLEELGVPEPIPQGIAHEPSGSVVRAGDRQYAASAHAAHGAWGAGVVWRIEDVTQARLAEARLEETRRALLLAEVSGGIGHEFNNLLSRVMGLAEDIQDESPSGRIHDLAETLIETAERGARVVRRLMTYSGSMTPDLRPVDLMDLLTSWSADQQADDLFVDVAACAGEVLVDPSLLRACLGELLKNARQAGAREVRVGCAPAADTHMRALCVADDGRGMDATILARATQPFFTTRPVGEGVGLGLSMVKGALDQCGGRLKIVSEPGKGTTVTLLLPPLDAVSAADV